MEALTLFLALRAFASGCAALTGIEAVSDGVPAFRTPEAQNARQVLAALGVILIALFVGITFLVYVSHVVPVAGETTNSQLARMVFGQSPLYYLVQGVTALILVLAANTSFADFPGSPRSWRGTASCRASSRTAGTGSRTRTASSS